MNREILKDLLPIMQAFADGKKIEYSSDGEDWIETETPTWNTDFVYRIKPEPKYRPFRTHQECWEEMHKHPDFGWLKDKDTGNYISIGEISKKSRDGDPLITWATNEDYGFPISDVLNDYTFTDGTPFGVKEE